MIFAKNTRSGKTSGTKWFPLEKNILNLDRPHGFQCCSHDLRLGKYVRMSRYFGCGSVLFWAEFCEFRTLGITWAASRLISNIYIGILGRILVKKEEELWSVDFVFKHGNANIHISSAKKNWFRGKNIEIIGSTLSDMFTDLLNILKFWQFEVLTPLKAFSLAFFLQEGSFQVTL